MPIPYLPYVKHPEMLSMGLTPLDPHQWIEPDPDWLRYQQHKDQSIQQYGERAQVSQPCAHAALQECHDLLLSHLLTDHPNQFQQQGDQLIHQPSGTRRPVNRDDPLNSMSQWIQDDLCILEDIDGDYHLTAASLCSPSYWNLEEKIGRTLDQIHVPIPGIQNGLTEKMNRVFHHLKVERPVARGNWSLVNDPGLMQRLDGGRKKSDTTDAFYLRVERQTLRRLPKTQGIVFTIRVYISTLEQVLQQSGTQKALHDALAMMTPDEITYKGMTGYYDQVMALFTEASETLE